MNSKKKINLQGKKLIKNSFDLVVKRKEENNIHLVPVRGRNVAS